MTTASRETVEGGRFVPGQPDMWAFVLFESLVFTVYFAIYLVYRAQARRDRLCRRLGLRRRRRRLGLRGATAGPCVVGQEQHGKDAGEQEVRS
jgi:heme/copper-type cytochrome/quinol oxidase subunit 3